MSYPIPGGPTHAGVPDNADSDDVQVHTEDADAISGRTLGPMKQQVVQVEGKRGIGQMIELLQSIDNRLKRIEEAQTGFST